MKIIKRYLQYALYLSTSLLLIVGTLNLSIEFDTESSFITSRLYLNNRSVWILLIVLVVSLICLVAISINESSENKDYNQKLEDIKKKLCIVETPAEKK